MQIQKVLLSSCALLVVSAAANSGLWANDQALAISPFVNLDQCSNSTSPCTWQNGALTASNSSFGEGDVVPFRLAIEGLDPTKSHSLHLNYDFATEGHKAYDFLGSYAAASASVDPCAGGGGGPSTLCPTLPTPASIVPFPSDLTVVDGLPVSGAETAAGDDRFLTLYGGTISFIGAQVHSGSADSSSQVDLEVSFTVGGSGAALFLWSAHIASSMYWDVASEGAVDGASQIVTTPWQMRMQGLDGVGATNQARAIVPPVATSVPVPPPDLIWPFLPGHAWEIIQGYNSPLTHNCRNYPYSTSGECFSFDLVRVDGKTAGAEIRSPVDGVVYHVADLTQEKDKKDKRDILICIATDDGQSVKLGHLDTGLKKGDRVMVNGYIGRLSVANTANHNTPHLHIGIYTGQDCLIANPHKSVPVPFAGDGRTIEGRSFPAPKPFNQMKPIKDRENPNGLYSGLTVP